MTTRIDTSKMPDKCQCEHDAHFHKDERTPNGNPAHKYQQAFTWHNIVPVPTPYGTFHVCRDCASDCYGDYTEQAHGDRNYFGQTRMVK